MKLVFVTDTLASGGAERVISILANNLCLQYDNVEIVCLRKHLVFYDINPKVKIVFAEDHSQGWISKIWWLRRYIKKDDIVVSFMIRVYCVTLLALLGLKRCKITSERNDPRVADWKWKVMRKLLLPTSTIHVVQTLEIKNTFSHIYRRKSQSFTILLILNNVLIKIGMFLELQSWQWQEWIDKRIIL